MGQRDAFKNNVLSIQRPLHSHIPFVATTFPIPCLPQASETLSEHTATSLIHHQFLHLLHLPNPTQPPTSPQTTHYERSVKLSALEEACRASDLKKVINVLDNLNHTYRSQKLHLSQIVIVSTSNTFAKTLKGPNNQIQLPLVRSRERRR